MINATQLYGRGLQAFQEYHPIADEFYGDTGEARTAFKRKLYRARRFGDDAAVFLLDARSFRDEGLAPGAPGLPLGAFEVTTGAIAYDAPFGPTVVGIAAGLGLIDPNQLAFYQSLPLPDKETFLRTLLDGQLIQFGLDPLGLNSGDVQATLLSGQWSATHTYGWTEFDIDGPTQTLTVTTYGVDPADPSSLPAVMQSFQVVPR